MINEHNFLGYYGAFTDMEKKQLLVKEYIDRNLDNFNIAKSRCDKETMIEISQKISNFVKRFENRHLYKEIGYKFNYFLAVKSFHVFVKCSDYNWYTMEFEVEED